ncbi:cell division protein [Halobacteriales archaeon QS_8_69_26]|nr:MAG: cell division protein [Halobacteriales archaeon QS_8_69_26]
MKLGVIGFGNAGSKIADRLLQYEVETGRTLTRSVVAVNTARTDLAKLEYVPQENQYLIGQTNVQAKGHGVGGDPELGAQLAREDFPEIKRALDEVPIYEIDAFLIVAGLGGGTGSGGAPVLAERLRDLYGEPVYGLAVLPSEEEGGRASLNAARSLPSFTESTDNLLLFDNETWRRSEDSFQSGYEATNREIVKRVGTLLSAGELDGSRVSENAMDSSDIRRTLGTGGVSTIAYAETGVEATTRAGQGLLGRFRTNGSEDGTPREDADLATKVDGLVRQAVGTRLTCPARVDSAERSLIVVSGPPRELSWKGVESARRWVERETGSSEVLAGDDPRETADTLSAVVLLSNVTDLPRVDDLQEQAVEAERTIEAQAHRRETEIRDLITDEYDELDPI